VDKLVSTIAGLSKVKTQTTRSTVEVMNMAIESRLKHLKKAKKYKSFVKFWLFSYIESREDREAPFLVLFYLQLKLLYFIY